MSDKDEMERERGPGKTASVEPVPARQDPNYKWRVLGSIGLVFISALAVTATSIFSAALSAGYVAGLFGMEFTIVLLVILLVLRYPSGDQHGFSMDNPWVSVVFSTVAGVLSSLFVLLLGSK